MNNTGWVRRLVAGAFAGLAGGLAMNLYSRTVSAATGGREGAGAAPGGDRTGRGAQPPQAAGDAEHDAASRTGAAVYRAVTGRDPDRRARLRAGSAAHYGFSAANGALYALLRDRIPEVTAGFGTGFGTAVWIAADEIAMPLLGLSRGPAELTAGVHVYALTAHWVYGATVETVMRRLGPQRNSD